MNLECGDKKAECCRSSREHTECINKTILRHYCTAEMTSVLSCWNEIEVIEMSVFLMKRAAIPNKHFICFKSCFPPINYQNQYIFLLSYFSPSPFICSISAPFISQVWDFSSLGVCLCFWPQNTVTLGVLPEEPCTKGEERAALFPEITGHSVVYFPNLHFLCRQ